VRNVYGKKNGYRPNICIVLLESSPNNVEVFDIKSLAYQSITIVTPERRDEVVRCYNCQDIGHTKTYYFLPSKCADSARTLFAPLRLRVSSSAFLLFQPKCRQPQIISFSRNNCSSQIWNNQQLNWYLPLFLLRVLGPQLNPFRLLVLELPI